MYSHDVIQISRSELSFDQSETLCSDGVVYTMLYICLREHNIYASALLISALPVTYEEKWGLNATGRDESVRNI